MSRKQRRSVTAGMELVDRFVSKDELKAIISSEVIAKAGTYSYRSRAKEKRSPSPIEPISW
ncbi:MAG: hypothetical protein HY694_13650 [Deltaproteobacteria bacterium]|nr:hypothetical protein [Deltaproteobacteria bacterium]